LLRELKDDQNPDSALDKRANDLRSRIGFFIKNVDALKKNYPESYGVLTQLHPKFVENEQRVRSILKKIEASPIAGAVLVTSIDVYNDAASDIDMSLESILSENPLSPEQTEKIAQLAVAVYDELFPETYVSQFVRWSTGQDSLENYQKWLLVPGEGIESAITNVISLFNPETWTSAAAGAETLYEMTPAERSAAAKGIKSLWDQIPPQRRAQGAIRWLVSVIFLCGGVAKMTSLLGSALGPYSLELLYLLRNLSKLKALPLAVLEGLRLTPV